MNWLLQRRTIYNRKVFVATSMVFGPPTVGLLALLYFSFGRGGPYPGLLEFGIFGASAIFVSYFGGALPALFTSLLVAWRGHLSFAEILALACVPTLISLAGSLPSGTLDDERLAFLLILSVSFIPAVLVSVALAVRWGAFEPVPPADNPPSPYPRLWR